MDLICLHVGVRTNGRHNREKSSGFTNEMYAYRLNFQLIPIDMDWETVSSSRHTSVYKPIYPEISVRSADIGCSSDHIIQPLFPCVFLFGRPSVRTFRQKIIHKIVLCPIMSIHLWASWGKIKGIFLVGPLGRSVGKMFTYGASLPGFESKWNANFVEVFLCPKMFFKQLQCISSIYLFYLFI